MNEAKNDIVGDLPKGWIKKSVKDVSKQIQYGYTGKALENGKYFYLRITDIQDSAVDWSKTPYSDISKEEVAKYLLNKGDIVFARTGATAGKSFLFQESEKSVFASYLIRVVVDLSQILPEYLYKYFQSSEYWEQIFGNIVGAAQPNFNGQKLGELRIPLPPLSEQKEIVTQLDTLFVRIDKAIQLAQENLDHINHLLPAALNDVFENAEEKGWKVESLSKVVEINSGVSLPSIFKDTTYNDGDIEFFKVAQMNNHEKFMVGAELKFNKETGKKYKIKVFPKGSILIPKRGGAIYTNKKRILLDEASYDSNVMGLKANNKILTDEYLHCYLNLIDLREYLDESTIPQINNKHIDRMEIVLPDLKTQEKIIAFIDNLTVQQRQLKQQYNRKLQQLKLLKASLLDTAFRGELIQQARKAKVIQLPTKQLSVVAEDEAAYQTTAPLNIPQEKRAAARVVLAAKIISLHQADENWTRIKFQKLLYLAEHIIKADWEMKYFIQTAGPLDNHFLYDELQPALKKKKWFQEVDYRYYPLAKAEGVEKEYNQYFEPVNNRLSKLFKSFLKATEAQSEIAATLYAVWNNLLIKQEPVSDERIFDGFYKWSERKEQYKQEQLISALKWMRENDLVPEGFGKEIKKSKK